MDISDPIRQEHINGSIQTERTALSDQAIENF